MLAGVELAELLSREALALDVWRRGDHHRVKSQGECLQSHRLGRPKASAHQPEVHGSVGCGGNAPAGSNAGLDVDWERWVP